MRLLGLVGACCLPWAGGGASSVQSAPAVDDRAGDPVDSAAFSRRLIGLFDFAKDWDAAAERAQAEKKLVLAIVQIYPGLTIPPDAAVRPFLEPELLELIRERFVALRVARPDEVPFSAPGSYGMGPSCFGASVLVATGEGEVVGDTFTAAGGAWLDQFLRDLLAERAEDAWDGAEVADGVERAERFARRGELFEARQALRPVDSLRASLLRARLHRRERDSKAARAELDRAAELADREQADVLARAEIDVERAHVAMGEGRIEAARSAVERARSLAPEGPRVPEIECFLGYLAWCEQDDAAARAIWSDLARAHPESVWAWTAAADLDDPDSEARVAVSPAWPGPELVDALDLAPPDPAAPGEADAVARAAAARLLAEQRPDGSWIVGTDAATFRYGAPDALRIAVTAIAAQTLLPERADPAVAAALRRAISWLCAEIERAHRADLPRSVMEYWPWAYAYSLSFLAGAVESGFVALAQLGDAPGQIVDDLRSRQQGAGGWTYLIATDPAKVDAPLPVSISFVTAAVLAALERAGEAGILVPPSMVEGAVDVLDRMGGTAGSFDYLHVEGSPSRPPPQLVGASGRDPYCSFVLLRAGRREPEAVARALRRFAKHLPDLTREQGKTLMHCGPEALGSHYVLFDLVNAARVVAELPEAAPPGLREALIESVLSMRRADGTFVDNPLIGRAYGTAMALQALRLLRGS